MGNFNLKSIWKQTGGTGGSTNLEQRVQAIENGYLQKNSNQLQQVSGLVDFTNNIVCKRNGYVDYVDTNSATSMINKQYLEQQLNTTKNQIRSENNTFTGTNTFNTGANALTYTTTNTTKNRQEVLTRNDMYYVKVAQSTGNITVNANGGYATYEFTVNGLEAQTLNEFYIVMTTTTVDIGYEVKIQCNNLSYPNQNSVIVISTSNWTNSNIDNWGFVYAGWVQHNNNKLRLRLKNTHTGNITFNGVRVYKRVSSKISDN